MLPLANDWKNFFVATQPNIKQSLGKYNYLSKWAVLSATEHPDWQISDQELNIIILNVLVYMVVRTLASQQERSWFESRSFCVGFACSPCVCMGMHEYPGFLPPSKNMHVGLIGVSKLTLAMSVHVHGWLSLCGPVMDWWPVQVVPCLSPNNSQDRLQPTSKTRESRIFMSM